ncbi:hypothetical protein SPISAL_01420 [Spiribacter salinus M19-40]|jgi:uncharacterized membrane protein SirB2|uniref:Invasion gene expression up-regulator SirB n=1 Tax=Spiribacter salinus M19-40 TaxID=1260251 RepID=R4VL86_9GAMM|nr:SirB2 family protein [Spiribacter salinus]AGM40383.1 hypothetical protein SPISAL_01420 [Spiribacter salinus M19-40]
MYTGLKHLHTTVATLTILLFLLKGFWLVTGSAMLEKRWAKIAPHVVNGLLLITALGTAWIGWNWPLVPHGWITAKAIALVAYIALGIIAVKPGRPVAVRVLAFAGAVAVYGYIVMVALWKQPLPV